MTARTNVSIEVVEMVPRNGWGMDRNIPPRTMRAAAAVPIRRLRDTKEMRKQISDFISDVGS